jgi:arabinogalactan oligomer/maltooligosaccharide transport system substrate-binding protein
MGIYRKIYLIVIIIGVTACSQDVPVGDSSTPSHIPLVEHQAFEIIEPTVDIQEENSTPEVQVENLENPGNNEPESGSLERIITLWHGLGDEDLLTLRNIILNFQRQESEIQVNLVYIPYDDLLEQYKAAVEVGEGPSLFLGAGEWGPGLFVSEEIDDISESVPLIFRSHINPAALGAVSQDETLFGLPVMISGVVMYRNTAIVSESPADVEAMIKSAQEATEGEIIGAYLERGGLFAFPHLTACEGSLMYPNGYPAFDSPAGICWLKLLKSFNDAGPVSVNSDDDLTRFKQGKVGIIIDGTWNLEILLETLGENLAIDPWPKNNNGHLSGYVWSENIYINPNLSEDENTAALIFSKYLLSQEAQKILSQNGLIPAITTIEPKNPAISQIITALVQGTPYPFQPDMKLYFEPLQNTFKAVFNDGVNMATALESAVMEIVKDSEYIIIKEGDS